MLERLQIALAQVKPVKTSENVLNEIRKIIFFLYKDERGKINPYFKITEYCNIVRNSYQQDSRALYTFVPDKSFRRFLNIPLNKFPFLKTFNSELSYIKVSFTNQYKTTKMQNIRNVIFSSTWKLNISKRLCFFVFFEKYG